jgi:hypothetical protein
MAEPATAPVAIENLGVRPRSTSAIRRMAIAAARIENSIPRLARRSAEAERAPNADPARLAL